MCDPIFTRYEEVADDCDLNVQQKQRYVKYMRARWNGSEEQKCQDGYAREWAYRFGSRCEYWASDTEGRGVLTTIDGGMV